MFEHYSWRFTNSSEVRGCSYKKTLTKVTACKHIQQLIENAFSYYMNSTWIAKWKPMCTLLVPKAISFQSKYDYVLICFIETSIHT